MEKDDYMLYIHESNLRNKINSNYKDISDEIKEFQQNVYVPCKKQLESFNFASKDINVFKDAAKLIDEYLDDVDNFSSENKITAQSKFRPTFVEEISTYLFKDLPLIKNNTFGIFNKNIYAGLKINNQTDIDIITKDVDFCIGKKVELKVDKSKPVKIIIPIVCVEVKTYLDATMFGEVQYSSRQLKNATHNVKTYVLMENNEVSKEKIIAARYDNNLNEMFVLRSGNRKDNRPIYPKALLEYYEEISKTIKDANSKDVVEDVGKILDR